MATKKNLSVEIRYTDEEQVRIDNLKAEIEKIDAAISSTLADVEKYEKYIKNLGVDINNLSNANFKLFDDLAKSNARNVDFKIALYDKEQSQENDADVVAIELAKKNEKDSELKSQAIQNEIQNNEKEIATAERKLKIAKEELRKLQFAVKKSETQKIEQQQYLDEIKATALKRQTAKK